MSVFDLVNELSHKYGIKFYYDLPEPVEGHDPVGRFCPIDQSIHLTKSPHIHTVFHEVGHYLDYRNIRSAFNIMAPLGILVSLLSIVLAFLGFVNHSILFLCAAASITAIIGIIILDKILNEEKIANKYADKKYWEFLRMINHEG